MLLKELFEKQKNADAIVSVRNENNKEIHRGTIDSCNDALLSKVVAKEEFYPNINIWSIQVK